MSGNEAKRLVQTYYSQVISGGDYGILDSLVSSEYLDHNAADAGRGPEVVREHMDAMRTTFPDFTMEVEQIFEEASCVVTRVTGRGTHQGEWMGIQPTGREISLRGINIDRVQDGKIIEHWGEADTVGMLMQMGVDPFAAKPC